MILRLHRCWWQVDNGHFMLLTEFLISVVSFEWGWRTRRQSCRQHISSPPSVTNIDVADFEDNFKLTNIQNLQKMTWKNPKENLNSVKRLQGRLLIWFSDMQKTVNGHTSLLKLNSNHIMVRIFSIIKKKSIYFSKQKSLGIWKGLLYHFEWLSTIWTSFS